MGACQFTQILIDSEMDLPTLTSALFHYSSVVSTVLFNTRTTGTDILRSLKGVGVKGFGGGVGRIFLGCMRLKRIESIGEFVFLGIKEGRQRI